MRYFQVHTVKFEDKIRGSQKEFLIMSNDDHKPETVKQIASLAKADLLRLAIAICTALEKDDDEILGEKI